jgi:hypothetical protein
MITCRVSLAEILWRTDNDHMSGVASRKFMTFESFFYVCFIYKLNTYDAKTNVLAVNFNRYC